MSNSSLLTCYSSLRYTILFAMRSEAEPFLALGEVEVLQVEFRTTSQFLIWSSAGVDCLVVIAGVSKIHGCDRIGQVAAAVMAREALLLAPNSCLVSAGTCGGVSSGLMVGDIIAAQSPATFYDHRVALAEFTHYADGGYPLVNLAPLLDSPIHCVKVSTGSSLDLSERDSLNLRRLGTAAKEMELAAVAQVAAELGGQAAGMKVVANAAGDEAHGEFADNLDSVSAKLALTLKQLLQNSVGRARVQS